MFGMIFEIAALLFTGIFAGAAIYVTFVEHPARLECGTPIALTEFRPSYKRATILQATVAVLGSASALGAWIGGGEISVLVAGALLGAAVPFTLLVIFPTNKRLLAPDLDPHSAEAATLLARWGQLHAVRTAAGTAAFVLLALEVAGAI